MHPSKVFAPDEPSLQEELLMMEQSTSSAFQCTQQLRSKLEEAILNINVLTDAKSRLEADLCKAKKDIQTKEADLVRAYEEIRETRMTANRTYHQAAEYRYELDRIREENRNYVIQHAYLKKKEVEDETPRAVLTLMRRGKKRSALSFPLPENHPHYPLILMKSRSQ
ncbi:hypothetical protein PENTCL1PPCAC_10711 [Pristionchus entomophagus]|uniref:Uncharacterized protein n=1 Tax=Pristionchus entomophagus TaxID=358040 RepID=A0AAV5TA72_9BILA|nr:hypothetical protein PENTCL1PPCAC_10711 [Pristionchus entomophagus]